MMEILQYITNFTRINAWEMGRLSELGAHRQRIINYKGSNINIKQTK